MLSKVLDVTTEFNAANRARLDLSGWGIATLQIISPSGTIDFTGTNDGGEETGTLSSSPGTSGNFSSIQAINLATGTATTSTAVTGMYKVTISCKYVQIFGVGVTATKILVFLSSPTLAL
jgi:hypothetical protein